MRNDPVMGQMENRKTYDGWFGIVYGNERLGILYAN